MKLHAIIIRQLLLLILLPTFCWGMEKEEPCELLHEEAFFTPETLKMIGVIKTAKEKKNQENASKRYINYPNSAFEEETYTKEAFQWHNYWKNSDNNPEIDFTQLPLPEEFYREAWKIADEGHILANSLGLPKIKAIQEALWQLHRPTLTAEILAATILSLHQIDLLKKRSLSVNALAILLKAKLNNLAISSFVLEHAVEAKIIAGNIAALYDPMKRWPLAQSLQGKLEHEYKKNERLLLAIEQENIPRDDL